MSDPHPVPLVAKDERPIRFLFENSAFLILGTIIALIWVNSGEQGMKTHRYFFNQFELSWMLAPPTLNQAEEIVDGFETVGQATQEAGTTRDAATDHVLSDPADPSAGDDHSAEAIHSLDGHSETHADGEHHHEHPITWYFVINDILMAFFFAIAAKEVWESMLPGGALSNPRKAAMPLLATLGGIVGPALLFIAGAVVIGQFSTLGRGWAVPCATDIAFSYLVGRLIFGVGHPAIAFLLLLAIADDAAGLVIIAIAYPKQSPELVWLLLSVAGMVIARIMTRLKIHSFWWYLLIPGTLSWFGFFWAHIHPALGLVPIIPFMPHAGTDLGIFVREELRRHDTLNEFEHWWKNPVEIILGLFGLCNAGVAFSSVGSGTWLVLLGLIVGKPLGIGLCTWIGEKFLSLTIPDGMDYRDVITLGFVAGIGFTVALFVATAAFDSNDPNLDPIKMGALFSFGAAIVSIVVAKILGVQTWSRKINAVRRQFGLTDRLGDRRNGPSRERCAPPAAAMFAPRQNHVNLTLRWIPLVSRLAIDA